MKKVSFKDVLPEYPSTVHLPWKPNNRGDRIADNDRVKIIFGDTSTYNYPFVAMQEKVDGANCGMAYLNGHPVVRTRTKILRKGQDLKNPSQKQFASAWNWMHDHKTCFDSLASAGPYSVYGEWMIQQHGMFYDGLPDWFVSYDVYDWEVGRYMDSFLSDKLLRECGFEVVPLSFYGKSNPIKPLSYEFMEELANYRSWYTNEEGADPNQKREGIVVKVSDGKWILDKFKMVRQGFDQGCLLGDTINRNQLRKG